MTSFDALDEEIRDARERTRRRERLSRQRVTLTGQIDEVRGLLAELERQLAKEDHDVVKLEQGGFFASLFGTKEERLARERAEAEAVRQRVHGQRARLEWLTEDLRSTDTSLAEVGTAADELNALLARKERLLVDSDDPRGRELADIAAGLANVEADLREHGEARQAGMAAGRAVGQVLRFLDGARGASTWDVFGGGGIADFIEHGQLRDADQAAWQAQRALDAFSRELADVGVAASPRLPKVDTRWFADMFFDNVIFDMYKHQKIMRTGQEVQEVARWVHGVLNHLAARCDELARQRDALTGRRANLLEA
ncbi:hypothetical protein [Microtetraspora sp. NBRC 16547]|uniref:hypothetical protein n=1 Tax=Microtetraspora sp. NBRC 16547 TaxID=3030993 RepID=UPI0024A25B3C|nr:hypothetical protein [Microtetraspora sp. NBRC 16547]GLX00119.1 hypothetical protein Misp02_42050 [Microtetraspora sp. NBRC 16547]